MTAAFRRRVCGIVWLFLLATCATPSGAQDLRELLSCDNCASFAPPAANSTEYVIGGLFSASGGSRERMAHMTLAMDHINNKTDGWWDDLLPGVSLRSFFSIPDCSSTAAVPMAFDQALLRSVIGVVGATCSSSSSSAQLVLKLFGLPQISPSATSPALSDKDIYPTFLRTTITDGVQGRVVAKLCEVSSWRRVGIVNDDTSYGNGISSVFLEEATVRNISVASHHTVSDTIGVAEMRLKLDQLVKSEAKVIAVFAQETTFQTLLFAAQQLGLLDEPRKYSFVVSDGSATTSLWIDAQGEVLTALPSLSHGTIGVTALPGWGAMYEAYTAAWADADAAVYFDADGDRATFNSFGPATYDATLVFAHALHDLLAAGKSPVGDDADFLALLRGVSVTGVSGLVSFDANADRVFGKYRIDNAQNGTWTEVGSWDPDNDFIIDSSLIEYVDGTRVPPSDGTCADDCNGRGLCDSVDSTCDCLDGYAGDACQSFVPTVPLASATAAASGAVSLERTQRASCDLPLVYLHVAERPLATLTFQVESGKDVAAPTPEEASDVMVRAYRLAAAPADGEHASLTSLLADAAALPVDYGDGDLITTSAAVGSLAGAGGAAFVLTVQGKGRLCPVAVRLTFREDMPAADGGGGVSSATIVGIVVAAAVIGGGAFFAFVVYRRKYRRALKEIMVTIDFADLEFGRELGVGGSATVFQGTFRGSTVAIKVIKDALFEGSASTNSRSQSQSQEQQQQPQPQAGGGGGDEGEGEFEASAGSAVTQAQSVTKSYATSEQGRSWRKVKARIARKLYKSEALQFFQEELNVFAKLRHPNVLLFMGSCVEPRMVIVTEYMEAGSLKALLHTHTDVPLTPSNRVSMVVDGARGMIYLHESDILHCDIKSDNLLITLAGTVKVADFGLSTLMERSSSIGFVGTFVYMCPEVWMGEPYTTKSDMFSFAVVSHEILKREAPYNDHMNDLKRRVIERVQSGATGDDSPTQVLTDMFEDAVVRKQMRCSVAGLPLEQGKLLTAAWSAEPIARPTFREFLEKLEHSATNGYAPPNLQHLRTKLAGES